MAPTPAEYPKVRSPQLPSTTGARQRCSSAARSDRSYGGCFVRYLFFVVNINDNDNNDDYDDCLLRLPLRLLLPAMGLQQQADQAAAAALARQAAALAAPPAGLAAAELSLFPARSPHRT